MMQPIRINFAVSRTYIKVIIMGSVTDNRAYSDLGMFNFFKRIIQTYKIYLACGMYFFPINNASKSSRKLIVRQRQSYKNRAHFNT